ncbi:MAG TPA: cation:proton antiporter [Thermoplasmata archaeon]|nr:cation:proton antiporter [Thermoplasmata archaeon]
MADLTTFIVGLFVLLTAAVLVGELFSRLGQAALVGQILVGIVLGPTLLGSYFGLTGVNDELAGVQFLATFFILVMAGLEVSPEEMYETGFASGLLGAAVFVGPFLTGAFIVPLVIHGLSSTTSLFVSLTLSITALPVMAVMLREFGLAKTRLGVMLMNTAVINELAAVTTFAILLRLNSSGFGFDQISIALLSVAVFLGTVLSAHMILRVTRETNLGRAARARVTGMWRSRESGFAVLMVLALGSALFSQYLGLTFLVGAFYAGLLITPESAGRREHQGISQVFNIMTWGFFIPLFFAFVGLGMNLRTLATPGAFLAFMVLVAFALASKIVIGTGVSRSLGWSRSDSAAIGFFVSSRGAVELAMALILLDLGIFTIEIFTIVAAVGLVTTIVSPLGAGAYGGFKVARTDHAGGLSDSPNVGPGPLRTLDVAPER